MLVSVGKIVTESHFMVVQRYCVEVFLLQHANENVADYFAVKCNVDSKSPRVQVQLGQINIKTLQTVKVSTAETINRNYQYEKYWKLLKNTSTE